MKTKRFQQYLNKKGTTPIKNSEGVAQSNDNKIDQDFSGYAESPSKKDVIKPETSTEKKVAAVNVKDGEKVNENPDRSGHPRDEQLSEGSGGAFEGTESVKE